MNSAGMRAAFLFLLWAIAVRPLAAEFRVGTAKADITPPIGSRMYGYGARGTNVSTGVHDPLFAKALVVSDGSVEVALVTLDLGSFGADNTRRVRELVRREVDLDGVLLIASHTHSAPAFDSSFPDPDAPEVAPLELEGIDIRRNVVLLLNGQPADGSVECVDGVFEPYCSSQEIRITLAEIPPKGTHLLQVQNGPAGPLSNEMPICVGSIANCD